MYSRFMNDPLDEKYLLSPVFRILTLMVKSLRKR